MIKHEFRLLDGKQVLYIAAPDFTQCFETPDELWSRWMYDARDDNPDLYAELVPIYFKFEKKVNCIK